MRIHLLSDLHLEVSAFTPAAVEADLVILAGDIHTKQRGVAWAAEAFPHTPVLYVPGNHEPYGGALPYDTEKLRALAPGTVRVMDRDAAIIQGVRFLGCTLWTDFNLFGNAPLHAISAGQGMNDYKKIRLSPEYRPLLPSVTQAMHQASRRWLSEQLAQPHEGPTVVITHHAPSLQSVDPVHRNDPLTPAYASAMDEFVADSGALFWLHGHTHYSVDYMLGDTRVVSNARGYSSAGDPGFDPQLILET